LADTVTRRLRRLLGSVPFVRRSVEFFRSNRHVLSVRGTRERIVLIGDGHVGVFHAEPGCLVLHLGSVTLRRLGRPGELRRNLRRVRRQLPVLCLPRHRLGADDIAIVVAGEIDVRCDFQRQLATGRRAEDVARELATGIGDALETLRRAARCRVGVLAVTPPVTDFSHVQHHDLAHRFPIRGTLSDRVLWTALLNRELRRVTSRQGQVFVDVPGDISDTEGALLPSCSDGTVHLSSRFAAQLASRARALAANLPFGRSA
jgi:hypothetical protein